MPFYTAQCDGDLICRAVTETTGPLVAPQGKTFVPLQTRDDGVLGKRWNGEEFEDVETN